MAAAAAAAADYEATISVSRDLSPTSGDSSSDHSRRILPTTTTTPLPPSSSFRPHNREPSHHHDLRDHDHDHHIQSTVEIQRKPRGRPPGSKNKPKPPVILTKDSDSAMKAAILEISAGNDVIEAILSFARKNHASISVISASGSVSNVTLRSPVAASHDIHAPPPSTVSLHGPFNILSLSGSFLARPFSNSSPVWFGISLAGVQGQVFGGIVAGKVVAAGQVTVVGATFSNSSFHRLPIDDHRKDRGDDDNEDNESVCYNNKNNNVSKGTSMAAYGVAAVPHNHAPINSHSPHDVMHWGPPY